MDREKNRYDIDDYIDRAGGVINTVWNYHVLAKYSDCCRR